MIALVIITSIVIEDILKNAYTTKNIKDVNLIRDDSSCDNNLNCNRRHPKELMIALVIIT